MGDQRRRGGRGRSGRGGRIPRRGEGQAVSTFPEEQFVSFPLDVTGPIRVASAVDEAGVEALLAETVQRERILAAGLAELATSTRDEALTQVQSEVERHREALEAVAKEVGADLPAGEPAPTGASLQSLQDAQQLARAGWATLQRIAYASGDKRVDRAVKSALPDKERHARVLESYSVTQRLNTLFKEPEE
jgi:hypothetical protein